MSGVSLEDEDYMLDLGHPDTGCRFAAKCVECPFTYCILDGDGDEEEANAGTIRRGILRNWDAGDRQPELLTNYIKGSGNLDLIPDDVVRNYVTSYLPLPEPPEFRSRIWSLAEKEFAVKAKELGVNPWLATRAIGRPGRKGAREIAVRQLATA